MALKLRLSRGGSKKRPYYRIVVTEATAPRDGSFIERVGTYNPMLPKDHEDRLRLFKERIQYWLDHGALPTERVQRFLAQADMMAAPTIHEQTKKNKPKAKAQEREREAEERRKALEAAAAEAAASGDSDAGSDEAAAE